MMKTSKFLKHYTRHVARLKTKRCIQMKPSAKNVTTSLERSFPISSVTRAVLAATISIAAAGWAITGTNRSVDLETQNKGITVQQLHDHVTNTSDAWVVINGVVYDLTSFLKSHPGGSEIIEGYAGKNASKIFNKFHGPGFIAKYLSPEECMGPLIGDLPVAEDVTESNEDGLIFYREHLPPLDQILTVSDFEYVASKILSPAAWYYYSTGAQDEVTLRENHNAFSRIYFKPRVFAEVNSVDLTTSMLGSESSVPFYASATAQAKLGHPDGELSISRGCGKEGVIQMISHFSSYPAETIINEASSSQTHWYQLYRTSREAAMNTVKSIVDLGAKALFVTVDNPDVGRREKDLRHKAELQASLARNSTLCGTQTNPVDERPNKSVKKRDTSVSLKDLAEIRSWSSLPLVAKGVQCVEDIILAAEHGMDAVVISNHGGRQLDFSRAPIEVLAEAMPILREKGLDDKLEIYIDGGVRRGGDIIKCLALGAKGVGLGRVFLYANACYGEAGVRKAIQLLKKEMEVDMRLLGVSNVNELGPHQLDLKNLSSRSAPRDYLFQGNYEPLSPPKFINEI